MIRMHNKSGWSRKISIGAIIAPYILLLTGFISSCQEEPEPTVLQVNVSTVEFEAIGGSKDIFIVCNTEWTITASSGWCTPSLESSEGDASVTLTATANEASAERTLTLLISVGDIDREILVTQAGTEDPDTIPEIVYDIPPDTAGMRNLNSVELAAEMQVGWNLGNSLDAIGGETSWGNPLVSQALIDSVKAAGFNAIRIPVAWSKFSDEDNFIILSSWLNRVEEVVNYVLNSDMYAIVNIHWDGGWMQPTYADESYVNNRLAIMWKQIATHFRDYNDHLLFAGTNEVMVEGDYGAPTVEYYTVQNGFNQTFVDAVRSTGGRNVYRHLVVQGFNTNINYTVSYAVMPADVVEKRLMMEVHYYDPYNFTINENSSITQWGSIATDPAHTETWANENYADAQFQKMKTKFIDQGVAVLLGEYGVISRLDVEDHELYRQYYLEYITQSMAGHGCIPFYWDNGYTGDHGLGLFKRSTGEQFYPELIDAVVSAVE